MQDMSRRELLSLAALAPLAGAILSTDAAPGGVHASSLDPQSEARENIRKRYFPNVTLQTQDGKNVRFYDDLVKDRIVTINFFFSHCDEVCPLVITNLVKVQKLLGDLVGRDIFMYSITLKPEEDNPATIKKYMAKFNAKPEGWTFLTGKPNDIEFLRKSLGFTYPDPAIDKDKTQHIGNVRYGNEPLMLWGACPGMAHAPFIAESISWMIRPETKLAIARR
jgi:protein SCO1/2